MPTSLMHQVNEIAQLIELADPQALLDIGVGFGKYGVLSREVLEVARGAEAEGEGLASYAKWKRRVDGIEVFPQYVNTPLHAFIYNQIHIGNALQVLPTLKEHYDLVLLIDVLEHFTQEDGRTLLRTALTVGRNLIVSTPRDIGTQTESFGNVHETHLFEWRESLFAEFGARYFVDNDYSIICFLGPDAARIRRDYRLRRNRDKLKRLHGHPLRRLPYKLQRWLLKRLG